MCDRYTLGQQLDRLKAHWPNLPTGNTAFDGYFDVVRGFTDPEVTAAVTRILQEFDGAAHPKPATLVQYCKQVAQRSGRPSEDHSMDEGVYCPICGTRELVAVPAEPVDTSLWDKLKRKFYEVLGLVNDGQPYLVLPDRMHPRCLPHCRRVRDAA
jgi:hypothetical protein